MNGRPVAVSLYVLSALLVSAFAPQSASATGTTAVTCKEGSGDTGGATFNTSHCLPGEASGSFGHYKIAQDTTTELTGQAGSVATKLKFLGGGVATTLTSTELTVVGSMENKLDPANEHFAHGAASLVYKNVTITPWTKCVVYTHDGTGTPGAQGVIDTEELTGTTTGQGHKLKVTPAEGEAFARFWILDKNKVGAGGECNIHGTYTVTGSLLATPEGATASTTHTSVTEQNTLKVGSVKAGIEGSVTLEGRAKGGGEGYLPLSTTTTAESEEAEETKTEEEELEETEHEQKTKEEEKEDTEHELKTAEEDATGTTAVTCKEGSGDTGGATFNTSHCLPGEASGSFGHYKIAQDTTTELTGKAGSATTKLKATLGGVATTLTSTELTGTGSMENEVDESKEHYIHSTGTIIYKNVTVSPFTKCLVYTHNGTGTPGAEGVVDTEKLTASTTGQGDAVKVTPETGTVIAKFWLLDKNKKTSAEGGECAISGTYFVTGSVVATPEGGTAATTHTGVTEQNTLKLGQVEPGVKAGIEGSVTIEGRAKGGGNYLPLSQTTTKEAEEAEKAETEEEAEETKTEEEELEETEHEQKTKEEEKEDTEHELKTAEEDGTGTTAVTCKEGSGDTGGATFNTSHCLPGEASGSFGHYKIAQDTTTELTGKAGSATTKLKATLLGVATTLTSTEMEVIGSMENKRDPSGEHYAHGTGVMVYKNVTVAPWTKCFVYTHDGTGTPGASGVVDTQLLTATTTGQGEKLKVTPAEGEAFARFWILDKNKVGSGGECNIYGTYTLTGSVIATPEGGTAATTHTGVTEQSTLKLSGIKAGIEGSVTIEGRAKGGGAYTPLSQTTV